MERLQHVVVIVPIDADIDKAQLVAEEDRQEWLQGVEGLPVRDFMSKTMMVMMMAITPSLNASIRFLLMPPSS